MQNWLIFKPKTKHDNIAANINFFENQTKLFVVLKHSTVLQTDLNIRSSLTVFKHFVGL